MIITAVSIDRLHKSRAEFGDGSSLVPSGAHLPLGFMANECQLGAGRKEKRKEGRQAGPKADQRPWS